MVFNVWDPSLQASIWVDANEFVLEFNMPWIGHQPLFFTSGLVVVFISNPLPLSLLTLFSRLFSLICMEGRMRQVLRRTSRSSTNHSSLVSSSRRALNRRGRTNSDGRTSCDRRTQIDYGVSCYSPRLLVLSRACSFRRARFRVWMRLKKWPIEIAAKDCKEKLASKKKIMIYNK